MGKWDNVLMQERVFKRLCMLIAAIKFGKIYKAMNKKRFLFLLVILASGFATLAQPKAKKAKAKIKATVRPKVKLARHLNPGQNRTGIANFRKLVEDEIYYAKDEFKAFEDDFNLHCNTGFTFSRNKFWDMCTDFGISSPCKVAGDSCYSIRILPAYNNREMYLVFLGEAFKKGSEKRTRLMRGKAYFRLLSTGDAAASSDLEKVEPGTSLYATLIEDIKNYSANLSEYNVFNVKSLSVNIDDYIKMEEALDIVIPPQQNKNYYIRLRPAYNVNTLSKNKLYFTANEEAVTESGGTVTERVLFEDVNSHPWYNHMNPCPDKCPINGFTLTKSEIKEYRLKFAKMKGNAIMKN